MLQSSSRTDERERGRRIPRGSLHEEVVWVRIRDDGGKVANIANMKTRMFRDYVPLPQRVVGDFRDRA